MFVDQCYDDVCFPVVVEFLFPPHFLLMLIIPVGRCVLPASKDKHA